MRVLLSLALCVAAGALAPVAQAQVADADVEKGKQVYTTFCQTCHGANGDGKGPVGQTLNPPPRDFTKADFKFGGTNEDIFAVISDGAASRGGSPLMAPWGAVIPESDRWALVKYIRSLEQE